MGPTRLQGHVDSKRDQVPNLKKITSARPFISTGLSLDSRTMKFMSTQNKGFKVNDHHELKALTKRLFNSYIEGLEEIDNRRESRTISKWSQSPKIKRFEEPNSTCNQLNKEQNTSLMTNNY